MASVDYGLMLPFFKELRLSLLSHWILSRAFSGSASWEAVDFVAKIFQAAPPDHLRLHSHSFVLPFSYLDGNAG
jgi:hypothetical protein